VDRLLRGSVVAAGLALCATAAFAQPPLPVLPLTQLADRGQSGELDTRTFSLTFAQPVPVKDLLLLLVRGTSLSVVPDPAIAGSFVGELKNVTIRQALGMILRPLGLEFAFDSGVIRVFTREPETRIFDRNYVAVARGGTAVVGAEIGRSSMSVSTSPRGDVFDELASGVRTLLTEHATFNVDRKAGLLQVTDFPERLDRIAVYLEAVQDRVHRQVQIDARVIEVEASDERAPGIDWDAVADQLNAGPTPAERRSPRRTLTALRVTDVARLMERLAAQGKVSVLAAPRLLTLNNEPSIVRTDTLSFTVTPQIASDSALTLSFTPMVKGATAVASDMLARVADGETLVVSGFTRDQAATGQKPAGTSGGWFGRATVVTHKRVEVVILLTPRIIAGVGAP
jgi:type II secretory pathway component GspD/PulD (secretin)